MESSIVGKLNELVKLLAQVVHEVWGEAVLAKAHLFFTCFSEQYKFFTQVILGPHELILKTRLRIVEGSFVCAC